MSTIIHPSSTFFLHLVIFIIKSFTYPTPTPIGQERVMKSRIESEVRCDVVHPVLEISQKDIEFSYSWTKNEEPCVQKKEISMKNISLLALNFYLKTEVPFNLSCYEFSLPPGQSAEVTLDFDPLYLGNKMSHVLESSITVVYRSHPYREKIKLTADIMFPNLLFESQDIAFGCFLNETSRRILVHLENTSTIPASYYWIFEEPSLPLGTYVLTDLRTFSHRLHRTS